MTTKFIDRITWNKTSNSYPIATTADKVFIEEEKHLTVLDFFSWVKNFFEKGAFFFFGKEEPKSLQTKVWIDTKPFFMTIPASSTAIDSENSIQTINTDDTFEIPFAVEKGLSLDISSITSTANTYVAWEDNGDTVIIYGTSSSSGNIDYYLDSQYAINYKTSDSTPSPDESEPTG